MGAQVRVGEGERLIEERVQHLSRMSPERPALTWRDREGGLNTCTFRELDAHVDRASRLMRPLADHSRCVVVHARQDVRTVAAILAAEICGYLAVLMPASLPSEETRMLFTGLLDETLGHVGDNRTVAAASADCEGIDQALAREGFVAQLTSGSTGPSRIAVRSRNSISLEINAVASRIGLTEHDTILCASSIAHSYGLIGGLLAPLSQGAHIVLVDPSAPTAEAEPLAAIAPTIILGLARTYRHLLTAEHTNQLIDSVRLCLSAGAPLPEGLFDAFLGASGIPIRQDYGTTETGTVSIDTSLNGRPLTVGEPLPHLAIRLIPPKDIPIRGAEQGEIQVHSAVVSMGYLQPNDLEPCVSNDGWYSTRDAGWITEERLLCVGGRLREAILVGGRPVRPEYVESIVSDISGVDEVFALPHAASAGSGLRVVAVAPSESLAMIQRRLLECFDAPRDQLHVELRESIPRSPAGKILLKYML